MHRCAAILCFVLLVTARIAPQSLARAASPNHQEPSYPDTSMGLQNQIEDILRAAKTRDFDREAALVQALLMPENSTWFVDEYGPGFGARLATMYRQEPSLETRIKQVYEGDVRRGWTSPTILRYEDPEKINAPTDRFLNCMNKIVPLYATVFREGQPTMVITLGDDVRQTAGDLDGYFVYYHGGFRFIPMAVLMRLPPQRPVRIQLDMNAMESKIITKVPVRLSQEALQKHLSGRVVVELIVGVKGNIKESKVLEGNATLGAAAIRAVRQWRFAPTSVDDDPVEVELQIPFTF
jgi:TonB family protein